MATNTCKEFLNHLELWMEGERHPDAQAHLGSCTSCRNLVEDLNNIHQQARSWNLEEMNLSPRVWEALRFQLEQEGLIRSNDPSQPESSTAGWFSRWFRILPRPVMAGAYLTVLIVAAFALMKPIDKQINEARWLNGTQVSTTPLHAQLNTEQKVVYSLPNTNPVVTASLQKNMAIVDNYISLCEKSVREEPQNEVARDYLYDAYQQKADLLAQMTERGENAQ